MANETVTYDLANVLSEMRADIKQILINQAKLEGRINESEAKLEGKINESEARLEGKINESEARLEGKINESEARLEGKINALETKVDADLKAVKSEIGIVRGQNWALLLAIVGSIGTVIFRMFFITPTP